MYQEEEEGRDEGGGDNSEEEEEEAVEVDDGEEEEEGEERVEEPIQRLASFTFSMEPSDKEEEARRQGPGGGSGLSPMKTLTRGARLASNHMDDDEEDFGMENSKDDSIIRDDVESDEEFEVSKRARAARPFSINQYPNNDDNDVDEEDDENDDDNDVEVPPVEGVYDPREFEDLPVEPEVI